MQLTKTTLSNIRSVESPDDEVGTRINLLRKHLQISMYFSDVELCFHLNPPLVSSIRIWAGFQHFR